MTEHKRLTTKEKYPHGAEGVSKDKLTGKYCRGVFEATACVEKLAEYETAEEEGRLVRLPCKVVQEMFFPDIIKGIIPLLVSEIWVQESDIKITVKYNGDDDDFKYWRTRFSVLNPDEIGRKFFFGREEAEKALKEMEGK